MMFLPHLTQIIPTLHTITQPQHTTQEAMAAATTTKKEKRWFPLESNPEVMQKYVDSLGLSKANPYVFTDVLSTEDWALAMVPQPVIAVLFLYPIKDKVEEYRKQEDEKIKAEGQVVSKEVYYMKQTVGNACGTVGLLHALANNRDKLVIEEGSFLANFFGSTTEKEPDEIAEILAEDDSLDAAHEGAAAEGQSNQIEQGEVDTHFITFVCKEDSLYELDGRKSFPINHGKSSPDTLLPDAARVIEDFIKRDEGELRFTIVALAAKDE